MFGTSRRNPVGRPDAELVAWTLAGDRVAFGELVRRYGASVRALLRRMGADAALTDDLAQDAFMTAFQKIGGLHDGAAFAPWVRQIAARLLLRRWRKDRRIVVMAETPEPEANLAPLAREPGALRLDLEQALTALTPAQRLCVSLCYGADLTHAEAAELLNAPLGTVKSHVKRGLDKLRAQLTLGQTTGGSIYG
jgi:RNA polymerase sigma-70 factor (ECF subfamily)